MILGSDHLKDDPRMAVKRHKRLRDVSKTGTGRISTFFEHFYITGICVSRSKTVCVVFASVSHLDTSDNSGSVHHLFTCDERTETIKYRVSRECQVSALEF